jgi:CubicO group peptidase (beta-lactamase class C family)
MLVEEPFAENWETTMTRFVAWHGKTLHEHLALRNQYYPDGFRFISLSIYGTTNAPVYAAVMLQARNPVTQHDFAYMTANEWQQTFNAQAAQGYGPIILAATGPASSPAFAAVFTPQTSIPLTRHGLTGGPALDGNNNPIQTSIGGMNALAQSEGLILSWAASYGTTNDPAFAGIWVQNSKNTLWNCDGLLEDATTYQNRFNAQTSVWCRPSFVTLNADNDYMSLFLANETGPWVAHHNMSPSDYQNYFNQLTAQHYYPVCVQAAGSDAHSARLAAIFVHRQSITPQTFMATGPVTNAAIDAQVEGVLRAYPVARQASLAIVNGTKLVYARGYSFSEADWPQTEPTTYFRFASLSKTVTALAIFQLIETGRLSLSATLQSVLSLRTPSGGPPTDPNFGNITIQHLLEHTSGLNPGANSDADGIVQAFRSAGDSSAALPVTQAMTDSFIAAQPLLSTPGTVQNYSNCGYYLLGRVAATLRGVSAPIAAYQDSLLTPLGITRIRPSIELVGAQLPGESRYQAAGIDAGAPMALQVAQSVMSPDQPMVAAGYGDSNWLTSQGGGGLSGAMPDLARLVAIFIDQQDNPALKRSTITSMLNRAAAVFTQFGNNRAGYGLDQVATQSGGFYYGQKGGEIINAAGVLQFSGDWGFALCFGGPAQIPGTRPVWYPDFTPMMNIAMNASWSSTDLFPEFGMASL